MNAEIKRVEVSEVDLPFRHAFRHALKTRRFSNSIFVKIYLKGGVVGYGESLPRDYVTGETVESVFRELQPFLPRYAQETNFTDFESSARTVGELNELNGAAKCCVEIALLDALGKFFNQSISALTGGAARKQLYSTAVIPAGSTGQTIRNALAVRAVGFKSAKLKVGMGNELERLAILRTVLGKNTTIRVDANCAWGIHESIEKIAAMSRFHITAVEQPARSAAAMKEITDAVTIPIIADESLKTVQDAQDLCNAKACTIFNIRLSKCGGLFNALRIAETARRNGMRCGLGCQVGESGVLSAAGRHFACGVENIEYYEGSYGTFLLKEDVTTEHMTLGFRGRVKARTGPGLGVTVQDKVLDKYTVKRIVVE